ENITLTKQSWTVPDSLTFAEQTLIPFKAGQTISWTLGK
ncbi:MAG: dihydroorotase, partial [Gammaproteobacteria bacterium]|nr:dihydroorotase [Gammaproteobacteria bacterium]MBT7046030.1 dihydroorotase [Gammaproteobacteria bacterium]